MRFNVGHSSLLCAFALWAVPSLLHAQEPTRATSWWERVTWRSDFRIRYEGFFQAGATVRHRERVRLRLGLSAPVGGGFEVGVRLATGVPGAITSTNQTLDDAFSPKSFSLDHAYLRLSPSDFLGSGRSVVTIMAGKFPTGYGRASAGSASELLFDGDLSPEGLHESILLVDRKEGVLRRLALVGEQWVIDEVSGSGDGWVFVEQGRAEIALGGTTDLTLSGAVVHTARADLLAQQRNKNSQLLVSNSLRLQDGSTVSGGSAFSPSADNPIVGFLHGYAVFEAAAVLRTTPRGWSQPLGFFADVAHNQDAPSENGAWALGASLGNARAVGEWEASLQWLRIETDAVLSMFNGSDMGSGGTNVKGFILNAEMQVARRVTLSLTDYIVKRVRVPPGVANPTLHRLHIALQTGF